MGKNRTKLSDQIRAAVDASGLSRYRIAKDLGIAESTMSRFMSGEWLGQENMNALADLLGLNIVVEEKSDSKGSKTKG
jgi:ribosome-binding protein aMBF1 (putative translation factor)